MPFANIHADIKAALKKVIYQSPNSYFCYQLLYEISSWVPFGKESPMKSQKGPIGNSEQGYPPRTVKSNTYNVSSCLPRSFCALFETVVFTS